ncbi:lipid asymmetry maintenance protein MlaB [Vogesella amnigena]|uniref:Lipid asymmetry maintenance protein MlaB n=1 Tax=Vogesella amnigena TaxID=1507449 RepID=A0ABV7TRE4_9NEIS
MHRKPAITPPATAIKLEGAMTVMMAGELREQLLVVLGHTAGVLRVDLSAVSELDSAGLQLLLALVREGPQVQLHSPSPVAGARIRRLGLIGALRLEQEINDGTP